jgi:hypothetical protein
VDASSVYLRRVSGILTEGKDNQSKVEELLKNINDTEIAKLLTQILHDRVIPGTELDRLQYIYTLLERYSEGTISIKQD